MARNIGLALVLALGGAAGGCLGDEDPAAGDSAVGQSSSALMIWIPERMLVLEMTGRGLNGRAQNGTVLDDRSILGVSLRNVQLPNGRTGTLRLEAAQFLGYPAVAGRRSLVGAVFSARLDDGSRLPLRVDGVSPAPEDLGGYLRYVVSYPRSDAWVPLCGMDEAGSPVPAVAFEGVWDYRRGAEGGGDWLASGSEFTFACEGYVLAKCAAMGYQPWAEGRICDMNSGRPRNCTRGSLQPFHQACTRALRADYCGDGNSHTLDGLAIDLYDGIGLRNDDQSWNLEAEWTAGGARCVERLRLADEDPPPACLADLVRDDCGDPAVFDGREVLLMTELPE